MHHPTKRKHVIIYQKRLHLIATLAVLAAPFLFLRMARTGIFETLYLAAVACVEPRADGRIIL